MSKRKIEELFPSTKRGKNDVAEEVKVKQEPGSSSSTPSVKQEPKPTVKSEPAEKKGVKTELFEDKDDDAATGIVCPYLDTINRKLLDFDFEKLCSVSLAPLHVYACLICGKYYQGRGKSTQAYLHSLDANHRVFINLHTEKIYCLPDNYLVKDSSLEDIRFNLHPTFTGKEVSLMDTSKSYSHALDNTDYLPSVIGLNNIKVNDWLNVIVQALVRVGPIKNFFLIEKNYSHVKTPLIHRFAELICKLWNPRRFLGHVSPHELLQAVAVASSKKFRIGQQSDPLEFLSWFLNVVNKELGSGAGGAGGAGAAAAGNGKKRVASCINQAFQGHLHVVEEAPREKSEMQKKEIEAARRAAEEEARKFGHEPMYPDEEIGPLVKRTYAKPFLYLSLTLPAAPLFKDSMDRTLIPQVPLFDLLAKFDGATAENLPNGGRRWYKITRLPRYLIVHFKRFSDNHWFVEKNPTLVNFPLKNLDMKAYVDIDAPTPDELSKMPVGELLKRMKKRKIATEGVVEKMDMVDKLVDSYEKNTTPTKYDLICNICHDGKPDKGTYRVHVFHRPTDTWFEMQDLHVWSTETMPQLVALSEAYIQIYELKRS